MTTPTPQQARILIAAFAVTLMTVLGAAGGYLLDGPVAAAGAGVSTGCGALLGTFLVRGRQARQEAALRGYADGIAHMVLAHTAAYEAAVFPVSGPGAVTPQERQARRTRSYAVAAEEALPHPVRRAAAAALAALDHGNATASREAMQNLFFAVHEETVRP
ncbi:hypothetical protein [Streptomyces sp. NBC_00316]|uniref:hypothetical protein n=1 Tax=Streptomyces sp. NBC_00316 TaxID=2975710 RepID=UPI002E290354|nr:hypothetical protein [Streptomyces sp. NBC_00316]